MARRKRDAPTIAEVDATRCEMRAAQVATQVRWALLFVPEDRVHGGVRMRDCPEHDTYRRILALPDPVERFRAIVDLANSMGVTSGAA